MRAAQVQDFKNVLHAAGYQVPDREASVAVGSAPAHRTSKTQPDHLSPLAALYAAAKVTWRQIADETGASFGELLLELAKQGLVLPRVRPDVTAQQTRILQAMLQGSGREEMTGLSLIITDSGPLITLAVAGSLDALLLPKLPIIVPDMVRFEVIRDLSKPGAQQVADWIRAQEGPALRVASTEIFEEYQILLGIRPMTTAGNRGEQAAAEVLGQQLDGNDHGAILLFEDSAVHKQNFLIRLPDEAVATSTSELLFGLESVGLVRNASEILLRATAA
ncbi:MAG: hypothetical protein ABI409_01445 [Ramlibacter sp.]